MSNLDVTTPHTQHSPVLKFHGKLSRTFQELKMFAVFVSISCVVVSAVLCHSFSIQVVRAKERIDHELLSLKTESPESGEKNDTKNS